MQEEVKDISAELPQESTPAQPRKEWRLRINYRMITDNLPFILFLAVVALVYIANNHLAEKKIIRINRLSREIKELKWE